MRTINDIQSYDLESGVSRKVPAYYDTLFDKMSPSEESDIFGEEAIMYRREAEHARCKADAKMKKAQALLLWAKDCDDMARKLRAASEDGGAGTRKVRKMAERRRLFLENPVEVAHVSDTESWVPMYRSGGIPTYRSAQASSAVYNSNLRRHHPGKNGYMGLDHAIPRLMFNEEFTTPPPAYRREVTDKGGGYDERWGMTNRRLLADRARNSNLFNDDGKSDVPIRQSSTMPRYPSRATRGSYVDETMSVSSRAKRYISPPARVSGHVRPSGVYTKMSDLNYPEMHEYGHQGMHDASMMNSNLMPTTSSKIQESQNTSLLVQGSELPLTTPQMGQAKVFGAPMQAQLKSDVDGSRMDRMYIDGLHTDRMNAERMRAQMGLSMIQSPMGRSMQVGNQGSMLGVPMSIGSPMLQEGVQGNKDGNQAIIGTEKSTLLGLDKEEVLARLRKLNPSLSGVPGADDMLYSAFQSHVNSTISGHVNNVLPDASGDVRLLELVSDTGVRRVLCEKRVHNDPNLMVSCIKTMLTSDECKDIMTLLNAMFHYREEIEAVPFSGTEKLDRWNMIIKNRLEEVLGERVSGEITAVRVGASVGKFDDTAHSKICLINLNEGGPVKFSDFTTENSKGGCLMISRTGKVNSEHALAGPVAVLKLHNCA